MEANLARRRRWPQPSLSSCSAAVPAPHRGWVSALPCRCHLCDRRSARDSRSVRPVEESRPQITPTGESTRLCRSRVFLGGTRTTSAGRILIQEGGLTCAEKLRRAENRCMTPCQSAVPSMGVASASAMPPLSCEGGPKPTGFYTELLTLELIRRGQGAPGAM